MIGKAILETLVRMGLAGTVLVAIALAVTHGRRPAWRAAVWLVVLAKFALPWGPAMRWSLADLLASHHTEMPVAALPAYLQPPPGPPHVWAGWTVLAIAWALGALFVLGRAAIVQLRAMRAARAAEACDPAIVAALAARVGVRVARLVATDAPIGPHVVGRTIVVPRALLDSPELLSAVLLHELAHVRRRDALARIVQVVATALFWWYPVVHFASRRLDAAREAACDAWALEASALPRPSYARLLVQMAQLRAPAPALAMPHALDARIAAVLGPATRPRLGWPLRLALLGTIPIALGGARSASAAAAVCHYTPEVAASLYAAHPEADLDGDGMLSRAEACEFQAELKKEVASTLDPAAEVELSRLLQQPLCCNCEQGEAYSSPEPASCQKD